jgi:hypothetical protein
MNPLIKLKNAIPLSFVALVCFVISPAAQALLPPPPPDGGYPNGNTAEGEGALFNVNVTLGTANTAIGFEALHEKYHRRQQYGHRVSSALQQHCRQQQPWWQHSDWF